MTRTDAKPLQITARDRRMIEFLHRFRLLTRDQIMAVAPFHSLTRANTRLAALTRAGVLSRKHLPIYPGHGSAQSLYHLGRKAADVVPVDAGSVLQQVRQVSRWDLRQVEHVRAANGVLIGLYTALSRAHSDVRFETEPELRNKFQGRTLVPDGWIAWAAEGKRFNCFLEIDLHHEGLTDWREKVLGYQTYADSGEHEGQFGFRGFRVLVLAQTARRLSGLRQVAVCAGRLFLFGELGVPADTMASEAVWLRAAGADRIRLMEA